MEFWHWSGLLYLANTLVLKEKQSAMAAGSACVHRHVHRVFVHGEAKRGKRNGGGGGGQDMERRNVRLKVTFTRSRRAFSLGAGRNQRAGMGDGVAKAVG